MKKIIFISLICLFSKQSFGQQDPQYTQYMYNMNIINPAYAGSSDATSMRSLTTLNKEFKARMVLENWTRFVLRTTRTSAIMMKFLVRYQKNATVKKMILKPRN